MTAKEGSLGGLPIAAGDILLKKYRVERLIGEGGTGIVLAASHMQLERRVAIKFLRRALESDELRTRFEREARAMEKIESDHVVLVLDAGTLDNGSPYMVMEYLEGRDLARVLKEDGPLPVEQAVDCMLQVCEALTEAHVNGIVHRDLKPANLFLTRTDDNHIHVKVVDFGISKILDKRLLESTDGKTPHEVTSAFTVLGSPRWMAPEQIRNSKDIDARADLWSVGAVLFQLITAKHAFEADGNVQASIAVLTAEPRKLSALAPHAPMGLEEVIQRCLTKDVTKRIQSASELAELLRPFASDRAVDSLDQIEIAKLGTSVGAGDDISIGIASAPPPNVASTLQLGNRQAPTERRIRIGGPVPDTLRPPAPMQQQQQQQLQHHQQQRHPHQYPSQPAFVTPAQTPGRRPSSSSKGLFVILGAGMVVMMLVVVVTLKSTRGRVAAFRARSSPTPTSTVRFSAERLPPAAASAAVSLDAGKPEP